MACASIEDSDQLGHPPSLIRAFAVRMKKAWTLSYPLSAQRRLWADAQADLSLRWTHTHFVGFDMRRFKCDKSSTGGSIKKLLWCSFYVIPCIFYWLILVWDKKQRQDLYDMVIWAPSSEFVSSSIPPWQILTAHAKPFREARDLAFCLKVPLDSVLA